MSRLGVTLLVLVVAAVGALPVAANAQDDLSPGCRALEGSVDLEGPAFAVVVENTTFASGEVVTARFSNVYWGEISVADDDGSFDEETIVMESGDGTLRYTFHGDETGVQVGATWIHGSVSVSCQRGWPTPLRCGGHPVTIVGTANWDRVNGTEHRDVILTGLGRDRIRGQAGNDVVCAGGDDDLVWGGTGADVLHGGGGDDLVFGGPGADIIYGNGGDDDLVGNSGADTMYGHTGDDALVGGGGPDTLLGGRGADAVFGGPRADDIVGGGGQDQVWAQGGDDFVNGGRGNDTLRGGPGEDRLWGAQDFDKCWGEQMRCEVKHRTPSNR